MKCVGIKFEEQAEDLIEMAISAINNVNSENRTCLLPAAQGAMVGGVTGLALKYAYPLNKEEKSTKEYLSVMKDIDAKKTSYSPWTHSLLDEINSKKIKSLAEDVFVKTYDGLEYGEEVGSKRVINAFRTIQKQKPDEVKELKRLFLTARLQAEKTAKKHVEIYNLATKHIRPTGFFVTAGAITGVVVAMAREILRTDVKFQ